MRGILCWSSIVMSSSHSSSKRSSFSHDFKHLWITLATHKFNPSFKAGFIKSYTYTIWAGIIKKGKRLVMIANGTQLQCWETVEHGGDCGKQEHLGLPKRQQRISWSQLLQCQNMEPLLLEPLIPQ